MPEQDGGSRDGSWPISGHDRLLQTVPEAEGGKEMNKLLAQGHCRNLQIHFKDQYQRPNGTLLKTTKKTKGPF